MDLRLYYHKLREIEATLVERSVVVVSLETPDGGRSGVKNEVPKHNAAKLIAEGRARLATPEESAEYRAHLQAAWQAELDAASLVDSRYLADRDTRTGKHSTRGTK